MVYNLFASQLLTFVLFTRFLTAAQLAAITAIMVAARVFDALNDPIMGNIIERTRSKYGKFKPWLVIGILTTSVVVYMMFNTKLQGWGFVWFFGVMYFLYSITYTMHDISYWGMVPALSSDPDARNQFTARATLFAGIGSTAASIFIPMFTAGSMTIGGSASVAYGRIALIIAILAPLFLAVTIFGSKENRDDMQEAAPPISFKKIFSTIAGNDQLLWVSLIFLVQQIGGNLVIGGLGSTYIYFEFGYSGSLYSLFTTVGMSATAFLMIFYPAISRRIQRKKLMGIMMIIASVGYVFMFIPGLLLSAGTVKFILIVIGYMLANFGQYCYYLIMMISIINTVEYNEYKTGSRDEAIIASLRPFITKLASALVVALTSLTYILFGVTDFTNRISTLEQSCTQGVISESEKLSQIAAVLQGVQSSQNKGLLFAMTIVPWLLMSLSYILYKRHYKLDEDEYQQICQEIENRKTVSA
jgi:melibiose permease/lactose/raffinose/galactose permease